MRRKFLMILLPLLLVFSLTLIAEEHEDEEAENKIPDVTLPDSVITAINASFQTVKPMLEYSCYDCHSQFTDKPWYASLPLVKGWMNEHIEEGRKHVDFSDGFPFKSHHSQLEILNDIKDEVREGDMPIMSYRIMHWGHLIEGEKQDTLFNWIDQTIKTIEPYYYPNGETPPAESPKTDDDED